MMESRGKYDVVPIEMKSLKNWVIWGINESRMKCPQTPINTSVEARANEEATWSDFAAAVEAVARLGRGGIGFEFGVEPCGIAGIDLDHVINDAGELASWAAEIVALMDSYTEYSPSGKGLHIFIKLTRPYSEICSRNKDQKRGLEIYDKLRYFTVTGKPYGEVKPLKERTEALKKVCALYLAKPESKAKSPHVEEQRTYTRHEDLSNHELWTRMFDNLKNGRSIRALYDGDTSGYGSHSEADLALCNHLAFWTNLDARQMDAMFRESGLMRDKWDEVHGSQTYGQITIARAIAGTSGHRGEEGASTGEEGVGSSNTDEGSQPPAGDDEVMRPVSYYLPDFLRSCLKSREGQEIPTGFSELDALLDGGLYPGLYVMGAISSLGKTTLALQIADNIAKSGHGVLIFSLEMSRSELMAKTLSRESLLKDLAQNRTSANALRTRDILRASFTSAIQERLVHSVIEDYAEWGQNLAIVEGIGDVGVERIKANVKGFMSVNGVAPVVVIDYLQILAPYSEKYTDKQNVDKNVLELKRLSRDEQVPIIGISSFNRENYREAVSMASYKESGAIEYGSDVLIGLQVEGIDRTSSEAEKDYKARVQEKLSAVDECKRRGLPVTVEAKIIKNRNGVPGRVRFEFHSRFNYFKESGGQIR